MSGVATVLGARTSGSSGGTSHGGGGSGGGSVTVNQYIFSAFRSDYSDVFPCTVYGPKFAPLIATPINMTGPYTYLWTKSSGDTGPTPTYATSPITNIQVVFTSISDGFSTDFICTVTDALGNTAASDPVTAIFLQRDDI